MKGMKRIWALALTFMMVFAAIPVSAESFNSVIDGSTLTAGTVVEDTTNVLTRGNFLAKGSVELRNFGSSTVGITGNTTCHMTCDQVYCNLYLEQLSANGNWYTYKYWNYNTTKAYTLTKTFNVSVAGGHWYRLRGSHIAIKGSSVESVTTATDGLWID